MQFDPPSRVPRLRAATVVHSAHGSSTPGPSALGGDPVGVDEPQVRDRLQDALDEGGFACPVRACQQVQCRGAHSPLAGPWVVTVPPESASDQDSPAAVNSSARFSPAIPSAMRSSHTPRTIAWLSESRSSEDVSPVRTCSIRLVLRFPEDSSARPRRAQRVIYWAALRLWICPAVLAAAKSVSSIRVGIVLIPPSVAVYYVEVCGPGLDSAVPARSAPARLGPPCVLAGRRAGPMARHSAPRAGPVCARTYARAR